MPFTGVYGLYSIYGKLKWRMVKKIDVLKQKTTQSDINRYVLHCRLQ